MRNQKVIWKKSRIIALEGVASYLHWHSYITALDGHKVVEALL